MGRRVRASGNGNGSAIEVWLSTGKNDLEKKRRTMLFELGRHRKACEKHYVLQKTAQIMVGLKKRARNRKRGRKGAVYMTEPQSRPRPRVGKRVRRDPKITQYENGRIRVRKYVKSAYGVIIMYFPCTLSLPKNSFPQ
jgi:hypothetical protein